MAKKQIKPNVCLACWNEEEAAAHAAELGKQGLRVSVVGQGMSGWVGYLRDLAADVVVIDLDRLPSHGREVGILLRGSKSTRHLPLVYLGGVAEKVERLRADLPDATYAKWSEAPKAIRAAIATPVETPVRPVPMMERYRDADLGRRLGVVPGVEVITWGDPDFLVELLGDLPEGVEVRESRSIRRALKTNGTQAVPQLQLWLCVVRAAVEIEAAFGALTASERPKVSGWIIHPKKTSRYKTDFNQNDVRDVGLTYGWVDSKVCARLTGIGAA